MYPTISLMSIRTCRAAGGKHFDTARIYAGGKSEEMAGRIMKKNNSREKYVIATKAHPSQPDGLSDIGIRSQLKSSLDALQIDKAEIYYLHQPDTVNPLTESLATINALISEGLIEKFALSNYSVPEVQRVLDICNAKGYPLPVAYQGLYNPINRRVESELLPLLRKHNMTFVAYNPLAAGMLTGKHSKGADVPEGRFKNNANYLDRFYKDDTFQGLDFISKACKAADLSMTQATYSWMLHHSMLGDGDGVLLGASKFGHLDENLACCESASALPVKILQFFRFTVVYQTL